jgi:hypothetical protein
MADKLYFTGHNISRMRYTARKAGIEIEWPNSEWLEEHEETDIM